MGTPIEKILQDEKVFDFLKISLFITGYKPFDVTRK